MIQDPYLESKDTVRLQSRVDTNDYARIRGLYPTRGVVQALTNRLIKHFVETLNNHGIHDWNDRDKLVKLLDSEYPLYGRRPVGGTAPTGHVENDRRGATGVRKQAPRKQVKPADAKGVAASGPGGATQGGSVHLPD